jgi:PPOX class probable F420-dependent enzyme
MPDYGVDTEAWEALPWSWAAERLAASRNLWVVTVSAAGRPHALPAWGVWDDDERRFGFSCGPRARKLANIRANPQVVVAVDDTVECVSVEGRATVVADEARVEGWIERYLAKYRALGEELSAEFLRAHVMVEVVPERAFAIIEREDAFSERATRWRF